MQLYFFSIEFGLCSSIEDPKTLPATDEQSNGIVAPPKFKIYGAGLLSSVSELKVWPLINNQSSICLAACGRRPTSNSSLRPRSCRATRVCNHHFPERLLLHPQLRGGTAEVAVCIEISLTSIISLLQHLHQQHESAICGSLQSVHSVD